MVPSVRVHTSYGAGSLGGDIDGRSIEGWEGKCSHITFLQRPHPPGLSEMPPVSPVPLARLATPGAHKHVGSS